MNKLVEYLLEMSFISLMVRCLMLGASSGDAILGISLVIAICYKHYYILRNQVKDREDLVKEIETIKSAVISMKMGTALTRRPNEKIIEEVPVRRF